MGDKLEIVNAMLGAVQEAHVSTLASRHPSVIQAVNALEGFNKTVQGRGWWFNRELNLKLVQDIHGEVTVPTNLLEFTVTGIANAASEVKTRYVIRKGKVYDQVGHTYVIGQTVTADIVTLLDIEDLPFAAWDYLKHYACENFLSDDDGDQVKLQKLEEKTKKAWHTLFTAELKATAPNTFDTPAAQALQYRIGQFGSPSNPMYPGGRFR